MFRDIFILPCLISSHRRRRALAAQIARREGERSLAEREAKPYVSPITRLPTTRHPELVRARKHVLRLVNAALDEVADLTEEEAQHLPGAYQGKRAHACVVLLRDLHQLFADLMADVPVEHSNPVMRAYRRTLHYCRMACRVEFARAMGEDVGTPILTTTRAAGEKHCPACDTVKPRTEFHRSSTRHDGCQAYCTECMRAKTARGRRKPGQPIYRRSKQQIAEDAQFKRELQDSGMTRNEVARMVRERMANRAKAKD